MSSRYDRDVGLSCPTCGGQEFSFESEAPEEEREYICQGCNLKFSYQEILEGSEEIVSRAGDEMKNEIILDITKDFKKLFK